jgi:hypothetical protein
MADSAFLKGVMELYQGEVMGEVIFYELLRTAEDDNQRYKLATMLQTEKRDQRSAEALVLPSSARPF